MSSRRCRPFTLADALVLVAAVAIGLVWSRNFYLHGEELVFLDPPIDEFPGADFFQHLTLPRAIAWLNWSAWCLGHCLAVVTTALFLLMFRGRSQQNRYRWIRRPGAVATGAVLLALLFGLIRSALDDLEERSHVPNLGLRSVPYWQISQDELVLAVLVAWSLLFLSGRWQRERGWLDTSGWVLGLFWLAQGLLKLVTHGVED